MDKKLTPFILKLVRVSVNVRVFVRLTDKITLFFYIQDTDNLSEGKFILRWYL